MFGFYIALIIGGWFWVFTDFAIACLEINAWHIFACQSEKVINQRTPGWHMR